MLTYSTTFLLLSNAVSRGRDKSIFFNRITILVLLYSSLLALASVFLNLDAGLELFGGLFHVSTTTLVFHLFIFLISSLILLVIAFCPRRLSLKILSKLQIFWQDIEVLAYKKILSKLQIFWQDIEVLAYKKHVIRASVKKKKEILGCFTISFTPIICFILFYIFNPHQVMAIIIIVMLSLGINFTLAHLFINYYYNKYNYYKDLLIIKKAFLRLHTSNILVKLLVIACLLLVVIVIIIFTTSLNKAILLLLGISKVSLTQKICISINVFVIINYIILQVSGKLDNGIYSGSYTKCFTVVRLGTLITLGSLIWCISNYLSLSLVSEPDLIRKPDLVAKTTLLVNALAKPDLASHSTIVTNPALAPQDFANKASKSPYIFEKWFSKPLNISYYKIPVSNDISPIFKRHYESVAIFNCKNIELKWKILHGIFGHNQKLDQVNSKLLDYYNTYGCDSKPQKTEVDIIRYKQFKIYLYNDGRLFLSSVSPKAGYNGSSQTSKVAAFLALQAVPVSNHVTSPSVDLVINAGSSIDSVTYNPNYVTTPSTDLVVRSTPSTDVMVRSSPSTDAVVRSSPSTDLAIKSIPSPKQPSETSVGLTPYISALIREINAACLAKSCLDSLAKVKSAYINIEDHIIQSRNITLYPVHIISNDMGKVNIEWARSQHELLNKAIGLLEHSAAINRVSDIEDKTTIYGPVINEKTMDVDMRIAIDNHLRHFHRDKYEDTVIEDGEFEDLALSSKDNACYPFPEDVLKLIDLSYSDLIYLYNNTQHIIFAENKIPQIYLLLAEPLTPESPEPMSLELARGPEPMSLELARGPKRRGSSLSEGLARMGVSPRTPGFSAGHSSFNLPQPSSVSDVYPSLQPEVNTANLPLNNLNLPQPSNWSDGETSFQPEVNTANLPLNNLDIEKVLRWLLKQRQANLNPYTGTNTISFNKIGITISNYNNNVIVDNMSITAIWDLIYPIFDKTPDFNEMNRLALTDRLINSIVEYGIKHSVIILDINTAKTNNPFIGKHAACLAAKTLNPVIFENDEASLLELHSWLKNQLQLVLEIQGNTGNRAKTILFPALGMGIHTYERYPEFKKVYKAMVSLYSKGACYHWTRGIEQITVKTCSKKFMDNLYDTAHEIIR